METWSRAQTGSPLSADLRQPARRWPRWWPGESDLGAMVGLRPTAAVRDVDDAASARSATELAAQLSVLLK